MRIVDSLNFEEWIRSQQKRLNSSRLAAIAGAGRSTVLHPSEKRIISTPREYQVELFERAKEKNTIAVLPTGSGKTLIAAMLIRHFIEQELISRGNNQAPRISFFLVDKIALVHQQFKVLSCNLDHNVARFHGDLIGSMSTEEYWKQQLEQNMVIVCTAEILHVLLLRGYLRMEQINLMVFDEAHHAKKNHPYATILKEFYAELKNDDCRRPRIMGMTASPVDANTDIALAAAQLECLLHSEIATVANPELLRHNSTHQVFGPIREEIVEYGCSSSSFETPLWQQLHDLVGQDTVFEKLFVFSKACTKELGRWCADRVWHLCLTPEEILKAQAKTQRNLRSHQGSIDVSVIDSHTAAIRDISRVLSENTLVDLRLSPLHLSYKVITLLTIFKKNFNAALDKCIIFVKQRLTAIILADLLNQVNLGLHGIRSGALVGSGNSDIGNQITRSYREQQNLVQEFHTGNLNVLVATSIAEEGLDIPDCNMIVRFDLYNTMIQYIQSKGRARVQDSKYFHMVEAGNLEHTQRVFVNQEKEEILRRFCSTLPENRLLKGNDFDMEYFLQADRSKRSYTIPSTGAKLTYKSSLVVLASFVASLGRRVDIILQPDYIVKRTGAEFQCQVILPDESPIKSTLGLQQTSKQVAKCSAAFEMCIQLIKKGYLDDRLNSVFKEKLPAMRNAQLALSSKKRAEYDMRVKPDVWSIRGLSAELYMTLLRLETPEALGRRSRPLALLSRSPLPQISKFPIFFGNQRMSFVLCLPLDSSVSVSLKEVEGLTEFTLRIFKDIFSKEFKFSPESLPYYFAPVYANQLRSSICHDASACSLIDWECVWEIKATKEVEMSGDPKEVFEKKFVTDPHDGSRKFYTATYRPDLKPTDPQIADVKGSGNGRARRDAPKDIWNYSISLWTRSRAKMQVRDDLPVVEAEYVPLRRNLLDESESTETNNHCYITFATLKLSALPVDVVAMAYNLPAIIYRLESSLIVLEACKALGLGLSVDLALEAMTKDSDNSDEHEEQINFQKGMGANYERLEFLGDAFLKMSTSIALYALIPEGNEFDYHVERMLLICNKNLFNNALDLKLEQSIRSKAFSRRTWYPDGLEQLSGKRNDSIKGKKGTGQNTHILGDKSIADVCEALIGAAYLIGKEQHNLDMAVRAVTILSNNKLDNPYHTMTSYAEYYASFEVPEWQSAQPTAVHIELARQIEEQLGYKFRYPRLLRSAFVHPSYSYMYEHIPHYQRLEFLGDALLDMACVDHLFHRYPSADPQWLTEHKMAMASNQFLGCLCAALGFQKHMISITSGLPQQVAQYVEAITAAQEAAEQEAEAVSRSRATYTRNFWISAAEPPKCLPDLVEAYIGALYVDSGFDYGQVERFFLVHILPYFEDMHLYDTFANKHPVTFLSNRLSLEFGCARWRVMVNELQTDHNVGADGEANVVAAVLIHGAVHASGVATSGRYAKIAAAKDCIGLLEGLSTDEFKEKYRCDCRPEDAAEGNIMQHATAI
ncbi:RNase3 domain-containing protein [Xylariales sp. PMI_506]|nr:RNase3 domain-containing protein [Xylariales sp. PMI_506]